MRVLITGAAGFIGFHLSQRLLHRNIEVVGLDCISTYYSAQLKRDRLSILESLDGFKFYEEDLGNADAVSKIFSDEKPTHVVNLAAQPGVRYSKENPRAYAHSNISGFLNVLESCRANPVEHLVFASTSSVYGATQALPFTEQDGTEHPLTFYAASKKANELMAHNYAHLFDIPATGVRFFTVYGPWGRPDMALFIFTKAILENRPIPLFNGGKMARDFTYVEDIARGLESLLPLPPSKDDNWNSKSPDPSFSGVAPYRILNIGRGKSEELMRYVSVLEEKLGKKAIIDNQPYPEGDLQATWADTTALENLTGFKPQIDIEEGVSNFVDWYMDYFKQ